MHPAAMASLGKSSATADAPPTSARWGLSACLWVCVCRAGQILPRWWTWCRQGLVCPCSVLCPALAGACPAQRVWCSICRACSVVVDLLAVRSPASSYPTGPSQRGPQLWVCSGRRSASSWCSWIRRPAAHLCQFCLATHERRLCVCRSLALYCPAASIAPAFSSVQCLFQIWRRCLRRTRALRLP